MERIDIKRLHEKPKLIYLKYRVYILLAAVILSVILAVVYFNSLNLTIESSEQLRVFVSRFGPWSAAALIGLIIVELMFLPLPASVIATMVGYMYGPITGTFYSYIAYITVAVIAFLVSRKFGRPIIEHIINKETLEKYDLFFRSRGRRALWFAYVFPFFPNVVMSFVIGTSRMRFKSFIIYPLIGYIPNLFLLNYMGHLLAIFGLNIFHLALMAVLVVILMIFYGLWHRGRQKL